MRQNKIKYKTKYYDLHLLTTIKTLILYSVKGVSQILLQESYFIGISVLISVCLGSIIQGTALIIGSIIGTLTTYILLKDGKNLENGVYGFNSALFALAIMVFFAPTFGAWLIILIGSVAIPLFQHQFIKRNIQIFTLPFILFTWFIFFISVPLQQYLQIDPLSQSSQQIINSSILTPEYIIKSFGQVVFQDNILSGAIILLSLLITSPTIFLFTVIASLFFPLFFLPFFTNYNTLNLGLLGFNLILTTIVFSPTNYVELKTILTLKKLSFFIIVLLLTTIISIIMLKLSLPQLTFPFVFASIIGLKIKKVYFT